MTEYKDLTQRLKRDGILFKGFGIVYKFVMQDTDLTLEAKAIYSHLSSFAGNKNSAFPKLETILHDLNLSKKGYYPHFNQLIKHGYISVSKSKGLFSHNIYTINNFPGKFKDYANQNGKEYTHLKEYGYGIIPKAVMIDPRLDIKAKGTYSYFASVGGSAKVAVRSQSEIIRHLNICTKTYYTYYNQLLDLNYIIAEQYRSAANRYNTNCYHLIQNPDEANARKQLPKMETGKKETPILEYGKKDTVTNINPRNKNKSNINIKSSSPTVTIVDDEIRSLKEKLNYDYQILLYPDRKEDIDKSIRFCAETLTSSQESFAIGSSCISKDSLRETFNRLTMSGITEVWDRIKTSGKKIANAKNYIITSLYNQVMNSDVKTSDEYRVEYKTFDLDHFFKRAVAHSMGT